MLHRASSAGNLYNPGGVGGGGVGAAGMAPFHGQQRRSSSPAIGPASLGSGGASLMPHRRPDFVEGSILEERDQRGRAVTRYRIGALAGKGGFATVYKVTDLETNECFALKVCSRQKLIETKTLTKLQTEIAVHRRMKHPNICKFMRTFQDEWNIYLVLELCDGTTLMDLSKHPNRKSGFSIPETQFIMIQLLSSAHYMHENNVIHRDLKLGNVMLDDNMNLKVGDFGLAAQLVYEGERKKTVCGTPNYIAPEILLNGNNGVGHSFEVDVWSIGVILYTLLVGEPPFQTQDVKATYNRIKQCRYSFPVGCTVPEAAKSLVNRILQSNPDQRPTLMEIRADPFFHGAPAVSPLSMFPSAMRPRIEMQRAQQQQQQQPQPVSARCVAPTMQGACNDMAALKQQQQPHQMMMPPPSQPSGREPLRPLFNGVPASSGAAWPPNNNGVSKAVSTASSQQQQQQQAMMMRQQQQEVPPRPLTSSAAPPLPSSRPVSSRMPIVDNNNNNNLQQPPAPSRMDDEEREQFAAAHEELHRTLCEMPPSSMQSAAAAPTSSAAAASMMPSLHPGCQHPTVFVSHYADFSSRYGMAYKLSTGHTGVHFNDNTKMIWEPSAAASSRVEYYTRARETAVNGQQIVSDQRTAFAMEQADESDPNIKKKTTLIKYFRSYIKAGGRDGSAKVVQCSSAPAAAPEDATDSNNMMIYVKRWVQTSQAMVFRLSNRVIQVCFNDGSEVILSSESRVVTFVANSARRTMPLSSVPSQSELAEKLTFTKDILSRLIANRDI